MKKRLFQATSTALFFVLLIGFGIGQESTYLSQKLMLERDLHSRIENALSKILDDQRYVLDVTVDLIFTPTVKEEVTFRPGTEHTTTGIGPKADLSSEGVSAADERKSRFTGLPIPGFEFGSYDEDEPAAEVPADKSTATTPLTTSRESKIVTQTYTDIKSSLPKVKRMEVSCILPEGSAPELIENVRQIIMVASKFDRNRGDVLSIMTASFRERKDEKTAEAVILRTIAHKIDSLENAQKTQAAEPSGEVIAALSSELAMLKRQIEEKQQAMEAAEQEAKPSDEEAMVVEALLQQHEEERGQREAEIAALSSELVMLKRQIEEKQQAMEEAEQEAAVEAQQTKMEEYANQVTLLQQRLVSLEDSLQMVAAQDQEDDEGTEEDAMRPQKLSAPIQEESSSSSVDNLPIYLMSAISLLAVIALAAVIIFNGRSKPKYVIPPWMMPPPKKKKVKKNKKDDDNQSEAKEPLAVPVQSPPQSPLPTMETEEDTALMQSEIKSTRQSVVSMSVGQPETATTIVREWLEQEASPPSESAQPAEATPTEPEPEAKEEKGKKKKKKKKK